MNHTRHRGGTTTMVALVAAAGLLGACGGDDSADPEPPSETAAEAAGEPSAEPADEPAGD